MTRNIFYVVLILILIIGVGYFMVGSGSEVSQIDIGGGNAQVMKLSVLGGSYVLSPNEVQQGVPVRIEADMSKMPGCSKSIVISAFNVRKTVSFADNTIEFTPTKAGTFNIACSMNMYRGTFTVR